MKKMTIRENLNISNKCLIIAEVAQAHDGSLGMAHAYIDAIADSGVDAVKFQTHIAAAESTIEEPWRVKFSMQDKTRYDYWKRMEFTQEQWYGLKKHAIEKGLLFISSPFSLEAVELLNKIGGVDAWKIASGEVNNYLLLKRIIEQERPILLSSGMSPLFEIDKAIDTIRNKNIPFAVMQCTSTYPTKPEDVGHNLLLEFRKRYNSDIGLSDHSGCIYPGLAAAVVGADVLEVHVVFSKKMFGPDVTSSLDISELTQLVKGVRFIEKMISNPIDKDKMADKLTPMRNLFTKSIVTRVPLNSGVILKKDDLTLKKPGTGIPFEQIHNLIGRKLIHSVPADYIISENDLEKR